MPAPLHRHRLRLRLGVAVGLCLFLPPTTTLRLLVFRLPRHAAPLARSLLSRIVVGRPQLAALLARMPLPRIVEGRPCQFQAGWWLCHLVACTLVLAPLRAMLRRPCLLRRPQMVWASRACPRLQALLSGAAWPGCLLMPKEFTLAVLPASPP